MAWARQPGSSKLHGTPYHHSNLTRLLQHVMEVWADLRAAYSSGMPLMGPRSYSTFPGGPSSSASPLAGPGLLLGCAAARCENPDLTQATCRQSVTSEKPGGALFMVAVCDSCCQYG